MLDIQIIQIYVINANNWVFINKFSPLKVIFMTKQSMEIIFINGEKHQMATQPLDIYLAKLKNKPELFPPNTACMRGYHGTWELKDDKLYLISFKSLLINEVDNAYLEVGIDFIFPNKTEVFANWFSGEIRVLQGDMLKFLYDGPSKYEIDLFLKFKDGYLIGRRTVDNQIEDAKRFIYGENKILNEKTKKTTLQSMFSILKKIFNQKRRNNLC